ncbi:diacylglycerol kinase family protein [Nitrosomonas sp. ANs5]|uniref:diacylglycerol kinase family protein n=1 Tax=Nitrosomonas sp. ANs5 TaxID=3423941 RepID=UPI003D32B829
MRKPSGFLISQRIASFGHALAGIHVFVKSQPNAWIHLFMTVIVVISGFLLQVTLIEWSLLVFAITIVLVSEALNTSIEYLCDLVSPGHHPLIKKSKDIAAGAVLISAIGAATIGCIIFLPHVLTRLSN